jgi:hypothetical protein
MTQHIGIAISTSEVAVVVSGGRRTVPPLVIPRNDDPLDHSLFAVLSHIDAATSRRARAGVVLSRPLAQRRLVEGLPKGVSPSAANRLVTENANRFFLAMQGSVVVGPLVPDQRGLVGVAFDGSAVDAIQTTLSARCRLRFIAAAPDDASYDPITAAAHAATSEIPAGSLTPHRTATMQRVRRAAVVVAVTSFAASAAFAVAAPSLRTLQLQRALSRELAPLRPIEIELSQLQRDIAADGAMLTPLARITAALPESTAVVSLRVDSSGSTLGVVGPRVTEALATLAALDTTADASFAGPVAHEQTGGVQLERATIRLRHPVRRGTRRARAR